MKTKARKTNPSHPDPKIFQKSFNVALEQMAQLLRSEVKLKDRKTMVLSTTSPSTINGAIAQIAKLLRSEARPKSNKKRTVKKLR